MDLLILLICVIAIFLLVGLVASRNFVLKSALSATIAVGILALYIYFEKSYAQLTSFKLASDYVQHLMKNFLIARGISDPVEIMLIGDSFFLMVLFFGLFFLLYLLFSILPIASQPSSYNRFGRKFVPYLLFIVVFSYVVCFFFSGLYPLVSFNKSFIPNLGQYLGWGIILS